MYLTPIYPQIPVKTLLEIPKMVHHPFRSARAQEECNRTLHVSHWKADGISPENQERPPVFARYLRMEVLKTVRKRFER